MTEKKAVTKKDAGTLALPDYGTHAGAGWDNVGNEDFAVPFLNQLQALSSMCTEGEEDYDPEAKPGMFVNSVTGKLYPGDVVLVMALTQRTFVAWKDQDSGGGFVGEYAPTDTVVLTARQEAKDPLDLRTKNGDELVETFKAFCLVLDGPGGEVVDQVVVAFSKTKIKRYKAIMTRLRTLKGAKDIPLFAFQLRMAATSDKNAAGKRYANVKIEPAVGDDPIASLLPAESEVLEVANGLREAILAGSAKADFASAATPGKSSGGDGSDEEADELFS